MRRLLALAAASAALACQKAEGPAQGTLTPLEAPEAAVVPLPDPDQQGGHVGRAPRRLTVTQLGQSILTTTGRQWSQLANLAPSLGKADFALVNSENTEPNLVFAKFLEDGAREVCVATAVADLAKTTPATRVLARELPTSLTNLTTLPDDGVRKNLVYLSTRFWGAPLAGAELDRWAAFFKGAASRAQTLNRREQAFAVTCIALMTDPRFLSY